MGKTFLYTEIQAAVPFDQFDWYQVNEALKTAPGLIRKTWLSGIGTHTVGGFYEFDSAENALAFAQGPSPKKPAGPEPRQRHDCSTATSSKTPAST